MLFTAQVVKTKTSVDIFHELAVFGLSPAFSGGSLIRAGNLPVPDHYGSGLSLDTMGGRSFDVAL